MTAGSPIGCSMCLSVPGQAGVRVSRMAISGLPASRRPAGRSVN